MVHSTAAHLECAIVARLTAALTLPGDARPKVEVAAWPDQPQNYRANNPVGTVLVLYRGARYSQARASDTRVLAFDADFEVAILARSLREPPVTAAQEARKGLGAYDLLDTCRRALARWQPDIATQPVQLLSEEFDRHDDVMWFYNLRLAVPMLQVMELMHLVPEAAPVLFEGASAMGQVQPPQSPLHPPYNPI